MKTKRYIAAKTEMFAKARLVLACAVFAALALSPLGAVGFQYGVEIESADSLSTNDAGIFSGQQRMSPWFDLRFPNLGGMRFTVQGSAYIRFNPEYGIYRPIFDLDLFRLQLPRIPFLNGFVGIELGRIIMADTHEMIMRDKVDGVSLHVVVPGIVMDLAAGYTGFQNYLTSGAVLSYDDFLIASQRKQRFYGFGSRRAVFQWSTMFPEFIGRASVYGDMMGQLDLRKSIQNLKIVKKVDVTELIDSGYVSAGINGPFAKSNKWFYDFGIVFEGISRVTAEKAESFWAFYINSGVKYFMKPNMNLGFRMQYGTPNNDRGFSEYRPITYKNAGVFYGGGFADLLKPELDYKWRISNKAAIDASVASFIRPRRFTKFNRDIWEDIYRYTELSAGGTLVAGEDLHLKLNAVFGMNNKRNNFQPEFALRLTLKAGL